MPLRPYLSREMGRTVDAIKKRIARAEHKDKVEAILSRSEKQPQPDTESSDSEYEDCPAAAVNHRAPSPPLTTLYETI